MKRLFLLAALPLLFFACAKEEVENPGFREPSCEDTTDDGRFEDYSGSEAAQFLWKYTNVPATQNDSVLDFIKITNRVLNNNGVDYYPYILYKAKRAVTVHTYVPLKIQQQQYYSWVNKYSDTSKVDTIRLYQMRKLNLQPGCYRAYYIYSDNDTGTVYTKGHYDIQIK
jgi:hypothetical protein